MGLKVKYKLLKLVKETREDYLYHLREIKGFLKWVIRSTNCRKINKFYYIKIPNINHQVYYFFPFPFFNYLINSRPMIGTGDSKVKKAV